MNSVLPGAPSCTRLRANNHNYRPNMNEASKEPPGNQERAKPIANRRSGGSSVSCPPYKPGLQQLVEGKQAWADPLGEEAQARGFLGWHQRGYLPHRDAPGLRQFVTFRLHDSFPASRRE